MIGSGIRRAFTERLAESGARMVREADPWESFALLFAVLLSLGSYSTTFAGFREIGAPWLLAFLFTGGAQTALLLASLEIAHYITGRRAASWVTIMVFLITISYSVWFSFVFFFTGVFEGEQAEKSRIAATRDGVESVINDVSLLRVEHRIELDDGLEASSAYTDWRANIVGLSELALTESQRLSSARETRISQLQRQLISAQSNLNTAIQTAASAQIDPGRVQEELDRAEARANQLRSQVNEAQAAIRGFNSEIALKQTEMDREEQGTDGRAAGRGPKWRALEAEKTVLEGQLERAVADRDALQADLDLAEGEARDAQTRLAAANASQTGGESPAVQVARAEVTRLQQALAEEEARDPARFSELVNTLNNDDAQGGADQIERFTAAANQCEDVRSALIAEASGTNNVAFVNQLREINCDPGSVITQIGAIAAFSNRDAGFAARCDLSAAPPSQGATDAPAAATPNVQTLSFDAAIALGRECISLSGLPTEKLSKPRSEISRIEVEFDPTASAFTTTANAVLSGEKLALMSFVIALLLDLLILFLGVMGARAVQSTVERVVRNPTPLDADSNVLGALKMDVTLRPGDPIEVATSRVILAIMHHDPVLREAQDGKWEAYVDVQDVLHRFDKEDQDYVMALRDQVRQVMGAWVAEGYAHPTPAQDGAGRSEVYALVKGMSALMRKVIRDWEQKPEKAATGQIGTMAPVAGYIEFEDPEPEPPKETPRESRWRRKREEPPVEVEETFGFEEPEFADEESSRRRYDSTG